MRFRTAIAAALLALLVVPGAAAAANPSGRLAALDGASEVPPVATAATGIGWVAISSDDTTITYRVEYSGLSGALTAAHIHTGGPGVAGGVILPLTATASPMDGVLTAAAFTPSGAITTFAQALAAIRAGTTYFNLHTAANPGGEIRGNLVTTVDAFDATINGAQEVPAVATSATGSGLVVFSADSARIWYRVSYSGLSGALTASHIHLAAAGANGGVMFPLAAGASPMLGSLTSTDFSATGSVADYAGAVAAIKAGGTYFNLHTAANPGGEVRGQIGAAAAAPTPAVTTPAVTTPPTSTVDGSGAVPGAAPILIALGLLALAMSTALVVRGHRPRTR